MNFKKNYQSPNFSVGGTHSSDDHTWRLNISTGYRPPHLSELFSDGIHHGSFRYEIGDRDLQPEYATQIDVSYEMHAEHFEFIVNPFYNYINNYIQIQSVDSIIDGASVFEYRQVELVQLYGLDVGFHYHPHFAHWLHLESSYSYIRGEELTGRSVALMPQARINSFLKLNLKNKGKFKMEQITVQHQYYFDQNQVSAYESTSPDYHLWNLGMDFLYALETPIRISLGVKNILNTAYINHLSGLKNIDLQHPGRSFYINIGYTINGKLKTSK
jgi:iron complex outermembrane receptor protein